MTPKQFRFEKINISVHAQVRAFSRTKLNSAITLAHEAYESLENGIDVMADETLRPMYESRGNVPCCGVYARKGIVFVFVEETLVTVYPIQWLAIFDKGSYEAEHLLAA